MTTQSKSGQEEDFLIAVVGPMSGASASQGQVMVNSAQLGVDEINQQGGIHGRKLRLVIFDDQSDTKIAADLAEKIGSNTSIIGVIGNRNSHTAIAAGPIYKKHRIPAITSTAAAAEVTLNNPWYYRLIIDTTYQGEFINYYLQGVLNAKQAIVISTPDDYGYALSKAFLDHTKTHHIDILANHVLNLDTPDKGEENLKKLLQSLKKYPQQVPLLIAAPERYACDIIKFIRENNMTNIMIGGTSLGRQNVCDFFKDLILEKEQPGFYTNNIYAVTPSLRDIATEKAFALYERYRARYGRDPDATTASYYDNIILFTQGLREKTKGNENITEIRQGIKSYLDGLTAKNPFNGALGRIYFSTSHNIVKPAIMGLFQNGSFISAPIQLSIMMSPEKEPAFEERIKEQSIFQLKGQWLSKTQVVYTGLDLKNISSIDVRNNQFTADFFIWFRYQGHLDIENLEFTNAVTPIKLQNPVWTRVRNNTTYVTYHVRGNFKGNFYFADYPFDHQTLKISLKHNTATNNRITLAYDELGSRIGGKAIPPLTKVMNNHAFEGNDSWTLTDVKYFQDLTRSTSSLGEIGASLSDADFEQTSINALITLKRNALSHLLKNFIPVAIIILVVHFAFYIPIDQLAPRITVSVSTILALTVLFHRMSGELPSIGYVTTMDTLFFIAFFISIHLLIAAILTFQVFKHKLPPMIVPIINYSARIGHPILFAMIVFSLWQRYYTV